jgi:LacI family transcriptional regulator
VPVVGYDLIPENIARLRDGSLAFLINQQPENQGYQAVYAIYRHSVLSEQVENQIRIPVDLVTRETLQFHQLTPASTKG